MVLVKPTGNYYDMIILAKFDWSNLYKIKYVNIALDIYINKRYKFYDVLLDTIEKTVPKKPTYTQKFPLWFTFEPMLIREKKRYK